MTFVITETCIDVKDTACVDVCPVDCIHPTKEEAQFEEVTMLYIDPDECNPRETHTHMLCLLHQYMFPLLQMSYFYTFVILTKYNSGELDCKYLNSMELTDQNPLNPNLHALLLQGVHAIIEIITHIVEHFST